MLRARQVGGSVWGIAGSVYRGILAGFWLQILSATIGARIVERLFTGWIPGEIYLVASLVVVAILSWITGRLVRTGRPLHDVVILGSAVAVWLTLFLFLSWQSDLVSGIITIRGFGMVVVNMTAAFLPMTVVMGRQYQTP